MRTDPDVGQAVDVEQVGDAEEVRDELGQRLLVDLLGRTELHDAAAVHHGEPVRHLERLLLVVRDEHEGDADLALQRGQLGAQRVAQLGVEGAERLVEEEHRRLEDERAGEGDALLLAAGQLVRAALRRTPLSWTSSSALATRAGPGLLVEVLAPPQPVRDVLLDVEVGEQRVALEDGVDRALVGRGLRDVDAVDEDLPVGRAARSRRACAAWWSCRTRRARAA